MSTVIQLTSESQSLFVSSENPFYVDETHRPIVTLLASMGKLCISAPVFFATSHSVPKTPCGLASFIGVPSLSAILRPSGLSPRSLVLLSGSRYRCRCCRCCRSLIIVLSDEGLSHVVIDFPVVYIESSRVNSFISRNSFALNPGHHSLHSVAHDSIYCRYLSSTYPYTQHSTENRTNTCSYWKPITSFRRPESCYVLCLSVNIVERPNSQRQP